MVDKNALKLAAVAVGGLVLLFVASFVLRFVSRILTWAVMLGLALAAGYVVYQLYSGWSAAGSEATADATAGADDEVASLQEQYASGDLSETELEAELEDAVEESDREAER